MARDVFALQERETGEIWWGAATGLFRLVGDEVTRLREPVMDRPVYFLIDDRIGSRSRR